MATKVMGNPQHSYAYGIFLEPYVILDDETNSYTGNPTTYIPYVTDITYNANMTLDSGVTVDSVKVTCGNQSATTANGTGSFTNVNSNKITFTAYAFAGSVTHTITLPRVNYIKPTCSIETSMATSGAATIRIEGAYFNSSFGAKNNTLKVQYRYKTATGSYSSWTTITPSLSGNSYSATVSLNLDYQTAYTFQARATDEFFTVNSGSESGKSTPVFDWSNSDFNFNVPVTPNGSIYLNGTKSMVCCGEPGDTSDPYERAIIDVTQYGYLEINGGNYFADEPQGTTNIYGYDGMSLYSGKNITLNADDITLNADGDIDLNTEPSDGTYVYINGELLDFESGTWSPKAYGVTRKVYNGNYVRFGEYCIINFYFEGTVSSADDMFCIYNLPFMCDSTRWWAGGGNISGAYANQNYAFCGWVIHDDGEIYARTAAVSQGDGQNVGSNYLGQNAGQTIIASGTIMYQIAEDEL